MFSNPSRFIYKTYTIRNEVKNSQCTSWRQFCERNYFLLNIIRSVTDSSITNLRTKAKELWTLYIEHIIFRFIWFVSEWNKRNDSIFCKKYSKSRTFFNCTMKFCSANPEEFTVVVGTNYLKKFGVSYSVKSLFTHTGYDENLIIHDIGLILLNESIQFNERVRPIRLAPVNDISPNETAVVTGWGRLYVGHIINCLRYV